MPADGDGEPVGTLICDEDEIVEKQLVTGIAYSKDEAKITLRGVQDKPGVAAAIFGPLADAGDQCRHDRPERLRGRHARPTSPSPCRPPISTRAMALIEALKRERA